MKRNEDSCMMGCSVVGDVEA
jgi:calpain